MVQNTRCVTSGSCRLPLVLFGLASVTRDCLSQEKCGMQASVFVGTSLDGFIARENGDLDLLPPGGGEPHGYDEFMATVDALVIGRTTFETVLTFGAWPYGEKLVFVLSTRPLAPAPDGALVERMSGPPADIVSRLAARGIRHAYVDGGITIQRFLEARAHPAAHHHPGAGADRCRNSALWSTTARCRPEARGRAPLRDRACPE